MTTALDGLRIIVIGPGEATAMAGMVLADNGAEVFHIQRPGGGRDRGRPGLVVWHRGTTLVELDLEHPDGRHALDDLLDTADGVILAVSAETTGRLGLEPERLGRDRPSLVDVRITGFGRGGPLSDLPGLEGIVAAASGRMASTNGATTRPIFTPVPIASFGAAMLAVEGLLAALLEAGRSGRGQLVETSLLHALSVYDMTSGHGNRTNRAPADGQIYGVMRVPFMTAPTKDGRFIQMCSRQPHHFRNWLRALGLDELLADPDLPHLPELYPTEERLAEIVELIRERMRSRTADEWMDVFANDDIGADPFLRADEYLEHPQCVANGRSVRLVDPRVGPTLQVGPLALMSDTPSSITTPAPSGPTPATDLPSPPPGRPGAHHRDHVGGHERETEQRRLPLEGITIVECGYFYATPFSSTLLAEAGARVIKVEPNTGDPGRRNWTTDYVKAMVGKESVVLDLKAPAGRALMQQLVDEADVFIHNFRPGTPERLGIGYDELIARNPRLVYVYGSCFGSNGPWSHKAGFHSSPNAIAGAGVIEAGAGNPPINRTYADPASALATAACVLLGLHARERTGRGQYIETVMLTSMAYAVSEWGVRFEDPNATKSDRVVDTDQLGFGPHHRLYPTSDGWIYVECSTDEQRASFDAVAGDDPVAFLRARPADDVVEQLRQLRVPAVRADGIDHASFMLHDPHCAAVGVAVDARQPGLPEYRRSGPAIRFAAETPLARSPALGADTTAVLTELGCTEEEIADLERSGVTRPIGHGLPG